MTAEEQIGIEGSGHDESNVFRFAGEAHRLLKRPGCVGMSVLRIHADEQAGLVVVHFCFDPGGEMDEHDAPIPILFIALSGEGVVRVAGVETPIGGGESSFWPPGVLHQVRAGESGLTAIAIEYGLRSA